MKMQCETVIISDTHLGSPLSMARELLHVLNTVQFRRLILLGDIFSDLNFKRLTKEHWQVISLIRKLSNPKRGIEVVWVEGNHDAGVTEVMEHLIGVKVFQQYAWKWNGKNCLAMHGHQYDGIYATGTPWFNGLITELHILLQKVRWVRKWLPRILDKFHTHYQRLTDKVAAGAMATASVEGAQYVFCGHTHDACHRTSGEIEYWNSGCWMAGTATYITLSDDVELHDLSSTK